MKINDSTGLSISTQIPGPFTSKITILKDGKGATLSHRWAITTFVLGMLFGYKYVEIEIDKKTYYLSAKDIQSKSNPDEDITDTNCAAIFNKLFEKNSTAIEAPKKPQSKSIADRIIILYGQKNGDIDAVKKLLESPELKPAELPSLAKRFINNKDPELVNILLEKGLDIFAKVGKDTLFDLAIKSKNAEIIEAFIEKIPQGKKFDFHNTPLFKLIENENFIHVDLFLKKTSHILTEGSTPLHLAVIDKIKEITSSSEDHTPVIFYINVLAALIMEDSFNPHMNVLSKEGESLTFTAFIHRILTIEDPDGDETNVTFKICDKEYEVLEHLQRRLTEKGSNYAWKMEGFKNNAIVQELQRNALKNG
jgi:hypothetical protein